MNGRSIQDIVPPARTKPIRPVSNPPRLPPESHIPMEPRSGLPFTAIATAAVVVVGIVVFIMSTVFHTALIRVQLFERSIDASQTYEAGAEKLIAYAPITVSAEASRTVPATGSVEAKDRASGTIVISNTHSARPQRLITNTRFATDDGKVYRIHAPVTVPGYTTRNGERIPGTAEAMVYADEPGEAYNRESATLKLPGLKGSAQYDTITATTKTPLAGGFLGMRPSVEKSLRDQTVADLTAELDRVLREKLIAALQPESVVIPGSIEFTYTEGPLSAADDKATITVTGSAIAPALTAETLVRTLAASANAPSDIPLVLGNPESLEFAAIDIAGLKEGRSIKFSLSGTAELEAAFDPKAFALDLAGKGRDEAAQVQASYRAITGPVTITVRPFWRSSLPANPERITVETVPPLDR
ncbi:hypothetical protein KGO06_00405 [Patescibacteria group bacterium]|nr:hypothetical protein [Patescibacteria group bacterium]